MHIIDGWSAANLVLVLYVLSFSLGYLAIHYGRVKLNYPFFVRLPIYLSVGLSLLTVISFLAGLIAINGFTLVLTSAVAWIVLARKWYSDRPRMIRASLRHADNLLPLAFLVISFAYFSAVVGVMRWPLPGDSIAHGAITSLILQNGVLRFDLQPLAALPTWYPPGLHVLTAHIVNLMGLYSAEGVLITGAMIASIIPSMLYSLTYFLTKSKLLSTIPFLSPFLVHMSGNLEMWVMGYFFNGSYPSFFGFLTTLTIMALMLERKFTFEKPLVFLLGIFFFQLSVTYPSLVLVITPFMFLAFLWRYRQTAWSALRSRKGILILVSLAAVCLVLIAFSAFRFVYPGFALLLQSGHSPFYSILPSFFPDLIGVTVLAAGILSAYLIFKREQTYLATFYIFTLSLCLLSLFSVMYYYIWYILPTRLMVINILFSWVVLSYTLHVMRGKTRKTSFNNKYTDIQMAAVLLAFVLVIPFISYSATLRLAKDFSWYSGSRAFVFDREVSVWINENIPSDEPILNDLSWSGFYLLSYSYKTVVFHYFGSLEDTPKLADAKEFWLSAPNATLSKKVLSQLNIKYVFTTSELGYYDRVNFGGDGQYKKKPFSPSQYVEIFDSYSFLRKVFQRGDSAVYQVFDAGT